MKNNPDLDRALELIVLARRTAIEDKRETAQPRNPLKARPGQEERFERQCQNVRALTLTLQELERKTARDCTAPLIRAVKSFVNIFWEFMWMVVVFNFTAAVTIFACSVLQRVPLPVFALTYLAVPAFIYLYIHRK